MNEFANFFIASYKHASFLSIAIEAAAFFFGIISVWYAKKENILVYPTGLIATVLTVYLLYLAGYFGDMIINVYFSVMSVYGWYNWSRKTSTNDILPVTRTNNKEKITGIGMFFLTIIVIFAVYTGFHYEIKPENYLDIFTSGLFFTAMWYMALKKIENWTLWIIGDLIAIPIYAYRGLGMLSLQYIIFTILAIQAYVAWRKIVHISAPKETL
jgi:nicotinamide mononucleotide transporter